ncbi:hypothetical protein C0Q70_10479 [Pomacea canaliculata]|uniref:C-type lectin domain-containing protein n=1 Tax=Pomacea canaliculata TaxID=400727 RepID=A0A2T7P3A3_POMCA|nr:hypothetical protein C0Q70_10479 [Pomacea canaliculata]
MLRAEIVEINSEEEHSFIGSLLDLNKATHIWIGMNDLIQEGTWVSASSGTPVNFTKRARIYTGFKTTSSKAITLIPNTTLEFYNVLQL